MIRGQVYRFRFKKKLSASTSYATYEAVAEYRGEGVDGTKLFSFHPVAGYVTLSPDRPIVSIFPAPGATPKLPLRLRGA